MENFCQVMLVSAVPLLIASALTSIYACFIDFQKAYDSVSHNGMFHKLSTKINGSFLHT